QQAQAGAGRQLLLAPGAAVLRGVRAVAGRGAAGSAEDRGSLRCGDVALDVRRASPIPELVRGLGCGLPARPPTVQVQRLAGKAHLVQGEGLAVADHGVTRAVSGTGVVATGSVVAGAGVGAA